MRPLGLVATLFAFVSLPTIAFAGPPPRPVLMVHYMPWYQARPYQTSWGWHWTMNHYNPEIIDEQGRRSIASHYYPLIGPYDSRDPDVCEYHALLMKVAGIDGAVVDWNGYSSLYDYPLGSQGANKIFTALSAAGLRFAICYEDQSVAQLINNGRITPAQAVGQGQWDMTYIIDHWSNKPAYLTLDGKPVVLNFGPQYFYNESDWTSILSVFVDGAQFFPLNDRLGTVAAGAFPWPPMWLSVDGVLAPETLHQYLDGFYASAATWPSAVGVAVPGFHDIYQQAGVQPSFGYLDSRDGLTFSETMDRALVANPRIIQLVTWNDFNEGTNIEPTREFGYQYLEHVQDVARGFGSLPYEAVDLELPYMLYVLRKAHRGDAEVMAQLNQAAAFIISGDPGQARIILNGQGTAALVSLVNADASPERVALEWFAADASGVNATVYRSAGDAWSPVARIAADGTGRLRYVDTRVVAGGRYGYSLGIVRGGSERTFGEVWVNVPALPRLALAGARPNPSSGEFSVSFTLGDAASARLEVMDAAGRRVCARDVGSLGAGEHLVNLTRGLTLPPGVYLVRLTRGDRSLTARALVVR